MYRTLPYFISRILVDVPLKVLQPILQGTIVYWAVGFQADAMKYLVFQLILILLALASNAIGLFLACIFEDVAVALVVAPLILLPLMMFSGFVLNPESIKVWLGWLEWLSPIKYAFSAIALNEFQGLELYCKEDQFRVLPATMNVGMPPSTNTTFQEGKPMEAKVCIFPDGEAYLENMNIQEFLSIELACILLAVMACACTLLAFCGLSWISRKSRAKGIARKPLRSGHASDRLSRTAPISVSPESLDEHAPDEEEEDGHILDQGRIFEI